MERFGEILKKLRKEHHLTQPELLARLPDRRHQDYDESEVSKWERGTRRPPEDVVEAFENVFSTAPGYLLEAAGYSKAAEYRRLTAPDQIQWLRFEPLADEVGWRPVTIRINKSTGESHALLVENGTEREIPVIYDPYRGIWKRQTQK